QDGFRAVRKWSVDKVRVASNPAYVCGTPEGFTWLVIEDVFKRHGRINKVATCGVKYAFWFACRARCVEDEQWVFRFHLFWWTNIRYFCGCFVPPNITMPMPIYIAACAF
ncbi:hypothetical protein D031_3974B, partial [Vibrio parahaemolyticus VP-48]